MDIEDRIVPGGKISDGPDGFGYMPGFGNTHSTQAEPGALPIGRNSPQRAPLGLYTEQLSGTAFTAPRALNRRSWLYRIRPSVLHGKGFTQTQNEYWKTAPHRDGSDLPAMQLRWSPIDMPSERTDFIDGVRTMTSCGDAWTQSGMAAHVYACNASMTQRVMMNCDGELLILPEDGALRLVTELGVLTVAPGELALVPRGVKFRVDLLADTARGYVCENYGAPLTLPERGPIGSNSLADARDFLYPPAAYEDLETPVAYQMKWLGKFYETTLPHSPLDVVAWHGNYAPYKYDLRRFATIGSISFDHPDPSIFTVLTSASDTSGTANIDFVIFPERWLVMEDTFRPPWYHTNVMSEFMGLVYGVYDAKPGGFTPGAMSLHNAMLPHGPDADAFDLASNKDLTPEKLDGTMAFMFETRFVQNPTAFASDPARIDSDYADCWQALPKNFKAPD